MPEGIEIIKLSLGDPTTFGNFPVPPLLINSVIKNLQSTKCNGYVHSAGTEAARGAIANAYSIKGEKELTHNDVIIGR